MPIDYAREGSVGYITLNRPPGNNYDLDGMEELHRAIQIAAHDPATRAIILRSGIRALFCLGADVRYLTEATLEENLHLADHAHATLSSIAEVPKPFIALLEGHTLGGGTRDRAGVRLPLRCKEQLPNWTPRSRSWTYAGQWRYPATS